MTETGTRGDVASIVMHRDAHFIGGAWEPSTGSGRIEVVGAATEEVVGSVPEGTVDDADRAVAAAARAFPAWSTTPAAERAELLRRLGAGLAARSHELARLIASEVGMPLRMATAIQAGLPAMVAGLTAQVLDGFSFEERVGNSLVVREPIGVVAAVTPWNYPLHQTVAKVAPALAAGCTVVHKPSEVAPLSAFVLAEVLEEIGLPAGVHNLVSGTGPVVGEHLASHPQVDMVSFTGSTRAGRRVAELAARTVKRVALELGGKSANVLLDDADLPRAVSSGVGNAFLNSGQTCSALTRLLVPRDRQEEVIALARGAAERLTLGDPLVDEARLGPLASAQQRERVRAYIERGVAEGARLVTGGVEPPDGLPRGYFVRPTIFADVTPQMTIAQEEIFGPVLAILPYDDDDEALRIANDTVYGLAGAVWSADEERARAFARRMRTGQVDVNGGSFNPLAPFGGYKQSGLGRELGRWGLEEFLETKSLQLRA
jgi:acyl-CoA reductase-like NAD-dependent aldehyde dehydrogenase